MAYKTEFPCVLCCRLHDGRGSWWNTTQMFKTEEQFDQFLKDGMKDGYDVDDWFYIEGYFERKN
jgi:hypothetical protein